MSELVLTEIPITKMCRPIKLGCPQAFALSLLNCTERTRSIGHHTGPMPYGLSSHGHVKFVVDEMDDWFGSAELNTLCRFSEVHLLSMSHRRNK